MKNNKTECANPWLCMALGFFLSFLGVLLGSIIGKGTGLKYAFGGIALRWVLAVLVLVWMYALGSNMQQTERATARQSAPANRAPAGWDYRQEQSPIDDSTTHVLRHASAEVVGSFDKEPAGLIIRQKEGRREVYITWPSFIGSRSVPVTVRFDKDEAVTDDWNCSTDGRAAFSPFPFADFWGMVKDSRKLTIRLTPYGESPKTVTFDLSNIPPDALTAFD
jgi:hypothetical protein